jgi:hypothetical protein
MLLAWTATMADAGRGRAQTTIPRSGGTVGSSTLSLKETLEKTLRARRPEEFAFIDLVIEKVDDGTLPRSLVESTFQWARKKPRHAFQYFEFALRTRAKGIGVEL